MKSGGLGTANKDSTREEKNVFKETEDEYKRKGLFKRIFPTYDFLYYK
jgi:hypothetical protein